MVVASSSWHSYPSIFALGHRATQPLYEQPVVLEEKVDGSQFSFGLHDGVLRVRSKGQEFDPRDTGMHDLFRPAAATAVDLANRGLLKEGWTYRGEALKRPRHNALTYGRVPTGHVIIFDVQPGHEEYLTYGPKAEEAARLGLEVVPLVWAGYLKDVDLGAILDRESVLGEAKIEGVVVKPTIPVYGQDKKLVLAKFVSEAFKEEHAKSWGPSKQSHGSVVERLVSRYKTDARWRKSVEHLRDDGKLEGDPRDIGQLIREIEADLLRECGDEIARALLAEFQREIVKGVLRGFPEWYKTQLAEAGGEFV